jgi:hypothetical protein
MQSGHLGKAGDTLMLLILRSFIYFALIVDTSNIKIKKTVSEGSGSAQSTARP